jgi:integrase
VNRVGTAFPLKIVPFQNRGGSIAWRVTGTLRTGRVQRNFPTETAAQVFVNQHAPIRSGNPPRPVITHLPEAVVREAEAACARLRPGVSLLQAVEFFRAYHRPVVALTIEAAIDAFGTWLDQQRKCELVTIEARESILKHFAAASGVERTDEVTVERAQAWIYGAGLATRTQRDRFDLLNFFCGWLVRQKHAATNPVRELDRPVHKVRTPGVLTFDETWCLLQCALTDAEGPGMLPYLAVCALSGVRPDEATRLTWGNVYLGDEHRLIEVNVAKGGRARRNVPLSDPLWKILTWAKKKGLAVGAFSRRKFRRIRRRAGLEAKWEKDLLRHTFASHRYVLDKDTARLAADMGNSERVLFQNYLRPVPLADGMKFQGLALHYSAGRATSAMGTGPKPRRKLR